MKTLILLIFVIIFNVNISDDIDKYKKAYEYIRDKEIAGEYFTYYLDSSIIPPFKIFISDKVYYFEKQTFTEDIINYEYNSPKGQIRKHIWDSLASIEVRNIERHLEDYIIVPELNKLNECMENYDLELLFSEFDSQNRLRACLIPCKKKFEEGKYFSPQCGTEYLFYFENNEIKKVFYKNFQQ